MATLTSFQCYSFISETSRQNQLIWIYWSNLNTSLYLVFSLFYTVASIMLTTNRYVLFSSIYMYQQLCTVNQYLEQRFTSLLGLASKSIPLDTFPTYLLSQQFVTLLHWVICTYNKMLNFQVTVLIITQSLCFVNTFGRLLK